MSARHCESCGDEDPATSEGYTACCNELVCDGRIDRVFGTATVNTVACCWAKAEAKGITEGWRHA